MASEKMPDFDLLQTLCRGSDVNEQTGTSTIDSSDAQRRPPKNVPEARHKAEIEHMRALIAEITAENLKLNKRFAVGRFVPSASGDESDNDFGNNYLQAEAIIATLRSCIITTKSDYMPLKVT